MLLWMCPNAGGLAAKALKPAFPNGASYWHIDASPKASTLARPWSDAVRRGAKSSKKSNKRAPALTPPPVLSLQNRHKPLTLNEVCDNTNYVEPKEANHTARHSAPIPPNLIQCIFIISNTVSAITLVGLICCFTLKAGYLFLIVF